MMIIRGLTVFVAFYLIKKSKSVKFERLIVLLPGG